MSKLKLSEVYNYLVSYITSSTKKNKSKLLVFRDTVFSSEQIAIAQDFLNSLDAESTRRGYYNIHDVYQNIYAGIDKALDGLKILILRAELGDKHVSDGGYISINSSSTTTLDLLEDLEGGESGTHLYQVFYFIKKQFDERTVLLDIGFFNDKDSIQRMGFFKKNTPKDPSVFALYDNSNSAMTNSKL